MDGLFCNADTLSSARDLPVDEKHYQQRYKHTWDDFHFIHLQSVRTYLDLFVVDGLDTVSTDKQAVRIDTIGCAGHQCDDILAGEDRQLVGLGGQDRQDTLDLVGVDLVEHVDSEDIALNDPVKVGESLAEGSPL